MTFEEWWNNSEYSSESDIIERQNRKDEFREAWNAAVAACVCKVSIAMEPCPYLTYDTEIAMRDLLGEIRELEAK